MNKLSFNPFIKSSFLSFLILFIFISSYGRGSGPNAYKPVANDDYFTTNEDVQFVGNVSTNDVQSNSGNNTWSILSNPSHGTVLIQANVFIRYSPVANYYGSDTFYYKICANNGQCDTGMVVMTINSVNDLPVAGLDRFTIDEDITLNGTVTSSDILSGDGGNTWSIFSNPINGSVILNANGSFVYTPSTNYNGKDSFYYRLCDVDGDCSTTRVIITIRPVNDLPIVSRDTVDTEENTPITSNVGTNDVLSGDGGNSFSLIINSTNGSVLFSNNGDFTYSPNSNFNGIDSFSYRLCDANGDCRTTVVILFVSPINHFPVTLDNNFVTNQNQVISGEVSSNDTPSSDGGNVWSAILGPNNGILVFNTDGSFEYTPNFNFSGSDTFYYSLCDVNNDCSYGLVVIVINDLLPIKLLSFTVSAADKNNAMLQWRVDQEINVNRYEIERSKDGLNFEYTGKVFPNSSADAIKSYSMLDNLSSFNYPVVYYRLKTIDNDGKYAYSKVIALQLNKNITNPKFVVYPNPFSSRFNLSVESKLKSDCILNIISTNGQKFLTKNINLNAGLNSIPVEGLSILPKGIYIVELVQNGQRLSIKVIKL